MAVFACQVVFGIENQGLGMPVGKGGAAASFPIERKYASQNPRMLDYKEEVEKNQKLFL